ncbi:MAG TPA: hypothetical protein VHJ19_11995 [Gammaproteobacteria bacterium]|nr:hypothetical protein [Gammaproteobacteria bacterium]
MLAHAAAVVDAIKRMHDKGVTARQVAIQWQSLMAFKHTFTNPVPENTQRAFEQQGIACCPAAVRFVGPRAVRVAGMTLESRFFVVATGA